MFDRSKHVLADVPHLDARSDRALWNHHRAMNLLMEDMEGEILSLRSSVKALQQEVEDLKRKGSR